MEKLLSFNISEILNATDPDYVGHQLSEYATVYVASFTNGFRTFTINALFNLLNEDKTLVIADDETNVIVNKLWGGNDES